MDNQPIEPLDKHKLLTLTVPGRWVVFPEGQSREQALSVLENECCINPTLIITAEFVAFGDSFSTGVISAEEAIDSDSHISWSYLPVFKNGRAGIAHTIQPQEVILLEKAFDSIPDWFRKCAANIGPKFADIKAEIERYLQDYSRINPTENGFVSWFIAHKIGGHRVTYEIPTDENNPIINGGNGSITYDFTDLYKNISAQVYDESVYEYCDFRDYQQQQILASRTALKGLPALPAPATTPTDEGTKPTALIGFPKIIVSAEPDEREKAKQVRAFLAPLSKLNPQKKQIMSQIDFDRLIKYTDYLVIHNTLPQQFAPIQQVGISNVHIRYTYYLLHKKLFGTREIRDSFIQFLHSIFKQFEGTVTDTTKSKFSTAPKSYDTDFKLSTG